MVVSEANIVMGTKAWVLGSKCMKHVCGNKNVFTAYNLIKEGLKIFTWEICDLYLSLVMKKLC